MKILFVCGSLEAGRDGVGDYVRALGDELNRHTGHQVGAMAIHDTWISEAENGSRTGFPMMRIPAAWTPARRMKTAEAFIRSYRPDWISIQFVPFAFHSKGLPVYLAGRLERLTGNSRVHVMLHEAWAGPGKGFRPKWLIYSFLQQILIKRLLDGLAPAVIHTHLPEYRQKLIRMNHPARELPLFSNIPVRHRTARGDNRLVIGFFSQVAWCPQIGRFLKELLEEAASAGLHAEILLIGGREPQMHGFAGCLENIHPLVTRTGFGSPEEISAAIAGCSLGVTPVPRHALGKSGSVAAFLSHGIPVAAPVAWQNRPGIPGFFSPALQAAILTEPDLKSLGNARAALTTARNEIRIGAVARKFLEDLNQYEQI